jgi:hypothetical protein
LEKALLVEATWLDWPLKTRGSAEGELEAEVIMVID